VSIAIEVFCCSGGMAEGFRLAGIDFALAFDKDKDACESYACNLGHHPVMIDVHDLVHLAEHGWRPDVWLLVADPPCTPWSSGGDRKGLADPRDCLRPTVELIKLLQPQAYLIGNVPGLEFETNAGALEQTIGSLSRHGYCTADFVVLDAADFGVPQHRVRPFWFGHRRGTPCITWPARTHGQPTAKGQLPGLELAPRVTAGEALADLPEAALAKGDVAWLDERPSTTVTADRGGRIGSPGRNEAGGKRYYDNAIVLSELARARLQGFPDRWVFVGKTKKSRNAQIGMAMPPALARAVAESIAAWRAAADAQLQEKTGES
jgi:DNA (cytosine-5)-methyltransferase 1